MARREPSCTYSRFTLLLCIGAKLPLCLQCFCLIPESLFEESVWIDWAQQPALLGRGVLELICKEFHFSAMCGLDWRPAKYRIISFSLSARCPRESARTLHAKSGRLLGDPPFCPSILFDPESQSRNLDGYAEISYTKLSALFDNNIVWFKTKVGHQMVVYDLNAFEKLACKAIAGRCEQTSRCSA